jgi:Nif-specific regulatory protein
MTKNIAETHAAPHITESDRRLRELELLYQISCLLDESLNLHDVVNPVLESLGRHMGMKNATLTLLNRQTGEIAIEAAHGLSPQQARKGRYRLGEGVTGRVALTGEPAIIPRTAESKEFLIRSGRGGDADTSFVCVPIKVGKEVVGALSVDQPCKPMDELRDDVRLLEIVAAMIAQAVKLRQQAQEERERLEEENLRLKQELKDRFRPGNIIGNSHEMQQVYNQIAQVARSPATV